MKKIILTLFLLTFGLSFSNSDIDIISKELWRCPYSVDKTFKGIVNLLLHLVSWITVQH